MMQKNNFECIHNVNSNSMLERSTQLFHKFTFCYLSVSILVQPFFTVCDVQFIEKFILFKSPNFKVEWKSRHQKMESWNPKRV